jgi:hypothetical protein
METRTEKIVKKMKEMDLVVEKFEQEMERKSESEQSEYNIDSL